MFGIWVTREGNRWILEGWCKPWGKQVEGTEEFCERWLANAWTIPGVKYEVRAM